MTETLIIYFEIPAFALGAICGALVVLAVSAIVWFVEKAGGK